MLLDIRILMLLKHTLSALIHCLYKCIRNLHTNCVGIDHDSLDLAIGIQNQWGNLFISKCHLLNFYFLDRMLEFFVICKTWEEVLSCIICDNTEIYSEFSISHDPSLIIFYRFWIQCCRQDKSRL